jgi:hypothetical protein
MGDWELGSDGCCWLQGRKEGKGWEIGTWEVTTAAGCKDGGRVSFRVRRKERFI